MQKLLVTFLFLSSSLCLNPGLNAFVSKKTIEAFKDSAWPKVKDLLSNIKIDGEQSVNVKIGTLKIKNLQVHLNIEANEIKVDLDPGNNVIKAIANEITFSGSGDWQLKTQFSTSGHLSFSGRIGTLQADVNIDNQQKQNGLIPKIGFNAITLNNVCHLKIHVSSSILSPILNILTSLLSGTIQSEIQKQLSNNGSLQNELSNVLNKAILDNYPVAIPISQIGIAISTYTTGSVKVFDTGLQVPAEGFTYAISSGYKPNQNCKEMPNYVDPANVTSDFYAALGDCSVQSAIDAQVETGFQVPLAEKSPLGDIDVNLKLQHWDGTSVEFHQDNLKVGAAILAVGKVGNNSVQATANIVANVKQTKKSATNELHAQDPVYKKLFPGITDGILASYDVAVKIESLDNFKVLGLPKFQANLLKDALMKLNITESFDVPQVCIANVVCMKNFNDTIKEGFIQADASVDYKPLKEEIS